MTKKPKNTAGLFLRKFKKLIKSSFRVKKIPIFISALFFVFLVASFGAFCWWQANLNPLSPKDKNKTNFVINKGESVSSVSERLKEQKLIKNPIFFKAYIVMEGLTKKIQAGTYQISASMTPKEISSLFVKGTSDQWVTIIEGLRQEQIGVLFSENGFAINQLEWQEQVKKESLEGRIFPDSYLFPKDADLTTIFQIIERNFQKKVLLGFEEEIKQSEFSLEEILVLASILEREARTDADRKIVAGILIKRLKNDWPLQIDASIQYVVANRDCKKSSALKCDWWPKSLTKEDLQINSPFNSYLKRGLPPSPICNPGLSSIKAALNPEESSYWFYLTGSDGKMHYGATDEEHAENIRRYL
jgi:UPF0755 protein